MHDPCSATVDTRRHLSASGYAEGNPLCIDLTIWPYVRVYADGITLGIAPAFFFAVSVPVLLQCNPVPVLLLSQISVPVQLQCNSAGPIHPKSTKFAIIHQNSI
jgi:hypothetical protein